MYWLLDGGWAEPLPPAPATSGGLEQHSQRYSPYPCVHCQAEIAFSVIDPSAPPVPANTPFPPAVAWPFHAANTCNGYLPQNTTLDRFIGVVNYLTQVMMP